MRTERREYQGLEVPVETWGSSAETLVFLPGLGVHPKYYHRGLELLARSYRIVVPDLSFRTHRDLPTDPYDYYDLVGGLLDRTASGAVWAGHSFGGLVALLHDGPAIACAPSVPAGVGLPRMFARAVHAQLREYLGLEGWFGFKFAARVLGDYLGMALVRPRILFGSMASLNATACDYPPRSAPAIALLCERDELYRSSEYAAYLDAHGAGIRVRRIADCHDWPITNPASFEERMTAAMRELRDSAGGA